MLKTFVLIFFLSALVSPTLCFPNGTSKAHHVCKTLKPHHNASVPQTSAAPFQVTAASDRVPSGSAVLVTLEATTRTPFKGFMLQARPRPLRKLTPFGTFELLDAKRSRLMECVFRDNNTATHNSPEPKTRIAFKWFPPKDFRGDVYFEATFVQSFAVFWTKIVKKVTIGPTSLSDGIIDAIVPSDGRSNTRIDDSNEELLLNLPEIYDGCGSVKQCFGIPQGCEQNGSCQTLVSVAFQIARFEFEIFGRDSDYVAINLTRNDCRDKNLIVECVLVEEEVIINKMSPDENHNSPFASNIQLVHSSFADGSIRCGFIQNHTRKYIEVHEFKMVKYSLALKSKKTDTHSEATTLFERIHFNTTGNFSSATNNSNQREEEQWSHEPQHNATGIFMWLFMILRFSIRLV